MAFYYGVSNPCIIALATLVLLRLFYPSIPLLLLQEPSTTTTRALYCYYKSPLLLLTLYMFRLQHYYQEPDGLACCLKVPSYPQSPPTLIPGKNPTWMGLKCVNGYNASKRGSLRQVIGKGCRFSRSVLGGYCCGRMRC